MGVHNTANQAKSCISELALYLDQNPSDCSHEAISSLRQSFEVLRCFILFCSGECFVKVLDLFRDPIAQIFVDPVAHKMLQLSPKGLVKAHVERKAKL